MEASVARRSGLIERVDNDRAGELPRCAIHDVFGEIFTHHIQPQLAAVAFCQSAQNDSQIDVEIFQHALVKIDTETVPAETQLEDSGVLIARGQCSLDEKVEPLVNCFEAPVGSPVVPSREGTVGAGHVNRAADMEVESIRVGAASVSDGDLMEATVRLLGETAVLCGFGHDSLPFDVRYGICSDGVPVAP